MSNKHITKIIHPQSAGSIFDTITKQYALEEITKNDGDNTYLTESLQPLNGAQNNIPGNAEIELPLSSPNMHYTALHDSFISTVLKITVNFQGFPSTPPPNLDNYSHIYESIFVNIGYKASINAIIQKQFKHFNATISNSLKNNCVIESFLDNTYKPESEKKNRKHLYSLYDAVHEFDPSCAGANVSLKDIYLGNGTVTFELPLNIPYDDFLELQAFRDYPSVLFGDLSVAFHLGSTGMVYTQVNPKESIDKMMFMNGYNYKFEEAKTENVKNIDDVQVELFSTAPRYPIEIMEGINSFGAAELTVPCDYTREFTQIGLRAKLITDVIFDGTTASVVGFEYATITPRVTNIDIKTISSELAGYKASKETNNKLKEFFKTQPFVVASQGVEINHFDNPPTSGGLTCSLSCPFNHVTDMVLLFPKYPAQTTCFENPMQKNLLLNTYNRNFPNKGLDFDSPRLLQMMLNASDLDSLFNASTEYVNSLIQPRATPLRRLRPTTDLTSYVNTFQTERSGGTGIYFDGLHSNGKNVSIALTSNPMYQGNLDTYYIPDLNYPTEHPPAPILCMIQDTFWIFGIDSDGLGRCKYIKDHTFSEYISVINQSNRPVGDSLIA